MTSLTGSKATAACEACRRRKTRCDGLRPQCGACYSAHTACVLIDERPRRGPKKGELRALKAQVAMLEKQLLERDTNAPQLGTYNKILDQGLLGPSQRSNSAPELDMSIWLDHAPVDTGTVDLLAAETMHSTPIMAVHAPIISSPPEISLLALEQWEPLDALSDLVRSDLDALYYLRVHPLLPMVHQWRYLSWARHKHPGVARSALRLAMWAIASAFSAQYRTLGTSLYHQAQNLANTSGPDQDLPWETALVSQLEQTQAWLLLAHYELLCVDKRAALQTAARVYRLVQASGLHNIDAAPPGACDEDALITNEEKRRTFWLAFCFDRLVAAQDSLQITLQEETFHVCLPISRGDLETPSSIRGQFLRDVVSRSGPDELCPLSETVVLATLYGRCITHRKLAAAANGSSNSNSKNSGPGSPCEDTGFWKRHEWLAARIQQRTQPPPASLSQLEATLERGPLAMVAHFLVRAAAIHLSDTLWCLGFSGAAAAPNSALVECRRRALHAAAEMASLARRLRILGSFRVHPYVPGLLAHAAAFLGRNRDELDLSLAERHSEQDLIESLRYFQDSNTSARQSLQALDSDAGFGF